MHILTSSSNEVPDITEEQVEALKAQGFTSGLAISLKENIINLPLRFWILDNSGSMSKPDGHRIISTRPNNDIKIDDCTRWEELRECTQYHINLSALVGAPTKFRLLNTPPASVGSGHFGIAHRGRDMIDEEVEKATGIIMKARPGGPTPLTKHIHDIQKEIQGMAHSLESQGKRVAIIVATDGLPTDDLGNTNNTTKQLFINSLRGLESLPVWLVIRICTDEVEVVNFYNGLDNKLELSLDVLDDFVAEGLEVHEHNPWLTYGLPLHHLRVMGFHDRVFDMLDQRKLTKGGELMDFCRILFGIDKFDGVADPSVDWNSFEESIEELLEQEKLQYNPVKKTMMPWINVKKLHKLYGDRSHHLAAFLHRGRRTAS